MIAVIDYDAGNIKSVEKALQYLGCECVTTRDEAVITGAGHVILPGVGAFGVQYALYIFATHEQLQQLDGINDKNKFPH